MKPQREVDHALRARRDLGASPEPRQIVANSAVVLLNAKSEVLASKELVLRNAAMISLPVVGQEAPALDADLVEEPLAGRIVTLTQNPGQGSELSANLSDGQVADAIWG